jgi:hypothetical protein
MPIPLLAIAGGAALLQAGMGYAQYRKGVKEAKAADAEVKRTQDAFAQTQLPEYRDVEARYKRISESGMESAEVNEFMRRARSSQYTQELRAQTMAGGSLARYTLALNNANMLGQIGTLAASNFQRKMQGLAGYERQLGTRQARTDTDTQFKRQMLMQRGQAAAGLSQSGLANITGALSAVASGAMSAAGSADTGGKISDPNYGTTMTSATMRPAGTVPIAPVTPIGVPAQTTGGRLPLWTDDSGMGVAPGMWRSSGGSGVGFPDEMLNTVGPR